MAWDLGSRPLESWCIRESEFSRKMAVFQVKHMRILHDFTQMCDIHAKNVLMFSLNIVEVGQL